MPRYEIITQDMWNLIKQLKRTRTEDGKKVKFKTEFLEISFERAGVKGSSPAKKDNDGCYFIDKEVTLRKPETISSNKEFCDCFFKWKFTDGDAYGASIGKTLPAYYEEAKTQYQKKEFTARNAANIPCRQALGTYAVIFER